MAKGERGWSTRTARRGQDQDTGGVLAKSKASLKERKGMGQRWQGSWTTGGGIANQYLSWADLWNIPQAQLPHPFNLRHSPLSSEPSPGVWPWGGLRTLQHPQRKSPSTSCQPHQLHQNQEWKIRVDLDRQLRFPGDDTTTHLSALTQWSGPPTWVLCFSLQRIEAAHRRKMAKYSEGG